MKLSTLIASLFILSTVNTALGQCRTFVKNNCKADLAGYVPGENFNAAKFMPGDQAELSMTMYSGQDYRLLICGQKNIPAVEFEVLDAEQNVLFNNTENEMVNHFDFRVAGTQNLLVRIKVPGKSNPSGISPQGCVAIMLGTKML